MASGSIKHVTASALACLLCGCPNPNLYTTPRATPVGRAASFVAPQLIRQDNEAQRFAPGVGMRLGIAPRLDLGVRSDFGSIATDLKWNAIRTERFDLALDAGVEILPYTLYVDLPILMGFNLSEAISLLPNTGLTLGSGEQPSFGGTSNGSEPHAGRVFLRGGFGAQFRLTESFAIQPELLGLHLIGGSPYTSDFVTLGLGFCWGRLPY